MNQVVDDNIPDPGTATAEISGRGATVLQVLPALGAQGGVERGTVEVAAAIMAAGGRAIVASAGGPLVHELARLGALHVEMPLNRRDPMGIYLNIARLAELIRSESVDIVHARSRAPAWSAYHAAKRTGCRFVTTFHGTYGASNPFKRQYNSVMTKGQRVIAISSFIAGHIRQIYGTPSQRIRIIHRGVDLRRFDPSLVSPDRVVAMANAWRLTEGHPVVMLPGRLTRWKGQMVFLDAIARLGRRDVRALLVGSDQGRSHYRQELENFIESRDLGELVRIVDHCSDMPAANMLSDLVVSASIEPEAFGRVIAEAQSMGRPVIASNHGGAREIVLEGETGWLTPPGDAEALARAMQVGLSLGDEERRHLATKAITRMREEFSTAAMCAGTLGVYDEVLREEPCA